MNGTGELNCFKSFVCHFGRKYYLIGRSIHPCLRVCYLDIYAQKTSSVAYVYLGKGGKADEAILGERLHWLRQSSERVTFLFVAVPPT